MVIISVFQQPQSPIIYEQSNTRAVLDNKDLGVGSIIISERTLCWKEQNGLGFTIEYPNVSMHAITKDPNLYPTECIFVIIDGHLVMPGFEDPPVVAENNEEEEDDDESENTNSQLIFVPPDSSSIQAIYNALNQCQLLNPDPEDVMDEEENVYEDAEEYNEEDFVASADRTNDLGAGGDTEMSHLSAQLRNQTIHTNYSYGNGDQNFDDDQFEDAD